MKLSNIDLKLIDPHHVNWHYSDSTMSDVIT